MKINTVSEEKNIITNKFASKLRPESNFVQGVSKPEMPLWVPVLRDCDLPEVKKPGRRCQEHCSGFKSMFLPGDRTTRQWWPQKKLLLRGTAEGIPEAVSRPGRPAAKAVLRGGRLCWEPSETVLLPVPL